MQIDTTVPMAANLSELLANYDSVSNAAQLSSQPGTERRKRTRTRLHWPIWLFRHDSADAVQTVTRDLSSCGFSCLAPAQFTPGELLQCCFKIPTHDPNGKHLELNLECRVRVVRVESSETKGIFAVACRIEDYQFAREADPRAS